MTGTMNRLTVPYWKQELRKVSGKIRSAAQSMKNAAEAMDAIGGEAGIYGDELKAAAAIAEGWAKGMDRIVSRKMR